MNAILCPACGRPDARMWPSSDRTTNTCIACETCGEFCITHVVLSILGSDDLAQTRRKLARYLYETREDGERLIHSRGLAEASTYTKVIDLQSLADLYENDGSPLDKYENTIRRIAAKAKAFGEEFNCETDRWLVPTMNDVEADEILLALAHDGFITNDSTFSLTPDGLRYAAELVSLARTDTKSVFIAACFNDELKEACNTICRVIDVLGYKSRIVNREVHNELIDLKIYELIRESRFMVADLTCNRQSVYYEVGFAHGLGLEVILTCRNDHLKDPNDEFKKVHFDLNHRNILTWNDCDELAEKLKDHVYQSFGAIAPETAELT